MRPKSYDTLPGIKHLTVLESAQQSSSVMKQYFKENALSFGAELKNIMSSMCYVKCSKSGKRGKVIEKLNPQTYKVFISDLMRRSLTMVSSWVYCKGLRSSKLLTLFPVLVWLVFNTLCYHRYKKPKKLSGHALGRIRKFLRWYSCTHDQNISESCSKSFQNSERDGLCRNISD